MREDLARERAGIQVAGRLAAGDHDAHGSRTYKRKALIAAAKPSRAVKRSAARGMLYSKVRTRRVAAGRPSLWTTAAKGDLQAVDAAVVGELLLYRVPPAAVARIVALRDDQVRRRIEQQYDGLHRTANANGRQSAVADRRRPAAASPPTFPSSERQQQPDDVALHGAAHLIGLGRRRRRSRGRRIDIQHSPPLNTRTTGPAGVFASTRNAPGYSM